MAFFLRIIKFLLLTFLLVDSHIIFAMNYLPNELLEHIFLYCSSSEYSFEHLRELLKLMKVDKKFCQVTKSIYNKRYKEQQAIANNKCDPYFEPKELKEISYAIRFNYVYLMHHHLKDNPQYKSNYHLCENKWIDYQPLHYAARFNAVDSTKLLLAAGEQINAQNKQLNTPLIVAIRACSNDVAQLLIEKNADITIVGEFDFVAEGHAHAVCNKDIMKLLNPDHNFYD